MGPGPTGSMLFTYRTDQQRLELWGLSDNGTLSQPANSTPYPSVPLRNFAAGGWDPGQGRYLLVAGNPQVGEFQSESRGGATFRGTLPGADGGPTVETAVTVNDAGTPMPMQLPESMTLITPPWASAAEVWGGMSTNCLRSPGAYRVGDPWGPYAVPLPFAAEPMRPVVLPQLGLLPLIQHGLSRQYFAVSDGGVTSVPLADSLGDGVAPPARTGICAIAAHAAWDSNRQRIASVSANGTLWELSGPDRRPSQVLTLALSSALLPPGAQTATLSARGLAGARGAPTDGGLGAGVELWIWDRSTWLPLGVSAGDETALQPFEVTISDPLLLSRLLADSAQTVQFAITSQAVNGAGSVTLSTQAVEFDFGYRVP